MFKKYRQRTNEFYRLHKHFTSKISCRKKQKEILQINYTNFNIDLIHIKDIYFIFLKSLNEK